MKFYGLVKKPPMQSEILFGFYHDKKRAKEMRNEIIMHQNSYADITELESDSSTPSVLVVQIPYTQDGKTIIQMKAFSTEADAIHAISMIESGVSAYVTNLHFQME